MSIIVNFVCAAPMDKPIICAKPGLMHNPSETFNMLDFFKVSILADTVGHETLRYSDKAAFEI